MSRLRVFLIVLSGVLVGSSASNIITNTEISFFSNIINVVSFVFFTIVLLDSFPSREANERVQEAEKKAYDISPESQDGVKIERLFDLYSKQIEKYQQETRTRATFSFFFAILSMCAGMGFMFWGGSFILADPNANHVAAGAAISAIGGGISAYITKTFLDVHKTVAQSAQPLFHSAGHQRSYRHGAAARRRCER